MLKLATTPLASLGTTSMLGDPLYTGWDTLFGITYDKANTAIQTNWSPLEMKNTGTFKFGSFNGSYTLDAYFGPWQITMGGDGKNIDLSCPISSGTYTVTLGSTSQPTDLGSEAVVKIEVGLEWIPDPNQTFVTLSSSDVPDIVKALISAVTSNPTGSQVPPQLVTDLKAQNIIIPDNATVAALSTPQPNVAWKISAPHALALYAIFYSTDKEGKPFLNVYQLSDSWTGQLQVQVAEADGTSPVTVKSIQNDPTNGDTTFPAAIDACFNANIGVFNHIFATLNLSTVLAQNNQWQWLTPTSTSYAVLDGSELSNSTFGILTMTGGRPSPNTQSIPDGLIPSNDGPSKASSDAAFLISSEPFMTEMILPVVMQIFDSTNESDFSLTDQTLQWTNVNDVTWGFFTLSDTPTIIFNDTVQGIHYTDVKETVSQLDSQQFAGNVEVYWGTDATPYLSSALNVSAASQVTILVQGSEWRVVDASNANNQFAIKLEPDPSNSTNNVLNVYPATQLHIPANQFKISLSQAQLDVSFINLTYAANSNYNVSINYQESWTLSLKEVSCKDANGNPSTKQVFWFTNVSNQGLTVSVTESKSAVTTQTVLDALSGALALITAVGGVAEGLYNAGQASVEIAEDGASGAAEIAEDEFAEVVDNADYADDLAQEEEDAATESVNQSTGKWASIKAAFKTPKWKAMIALSTLVGLAAGSDKIAEDVIIQAANNEWDNVPSFDGFANLCIAPYKFPNLGAFTLNSAQLTVVCKLD